MLSPFEWWCRNFILPDICKPCLFVFLRNLFYLTEELVAKRYLCAKIAGPLILEYYLLVSPLAEDLEIYGVKIVERRSGVAAIAPGLTTSGRKILHLIDLLSKGTVTPTSLADIVEDWL